ncbi:Tubby protein-like [Hondaea fermentalgiana]|uniref:Tubby protein-like n=1 Tax=Hondaea fermentalgiana TaxID=2315210 RepID=A0A2R5G5D2_9STRA|nr:Tubby protein-like [Hondaea fermentalgiana]|eukprot:GBG26252.1 Tubby protein-like [Hondaea fermentalgiana]
MEEVEERHEDTRLSLERAGARKIPLAVSPTSPVPGASQHDSSDADSDAERKKRKKTSKKKKKSKKSSKDKDRGSIGDDKSVDEDATDTGETDAKKSSKKKKKEKKEKSKKSSRKSKHSHDENEGDHEEDEEAAARRAARRETRKKKHSDKADENSEDDEGRRSSKSSKKSKHKSKRRHASSDNIDILADAGENDDAHKQMNEDDRDIEEEYKNASDGEEDADASEKHHHHRRSHRHGDKKSHKSSDESSSKKKKKKKKKDKDKEKEKEKKDGSSKHSSKKHRSSSHLDNQEVAGAGNGTHDAIEDNETDSARDEGFGVRGRDDGFAALESAMSGLQIESKGAEDASDDAEDNRVLLEDDLEEHELDAHDADRTDEDEDDVSRYEDDEEEEEEEEDEDDDEDDENEAKSGGHKMDEENEHSAWNQSLPSEIRDDLYVDEFSDVQDASQEMSHRIRKLRKLLYGPVPEGVTLKAQIDRHYDHSGSVYYSFILPVERDDGMRDKRMTLMIAKCRTGVTLKPTYVISLEPIDFKKRCAQRSERYFGKVQLIKGSDALGLSGPMQYVVYDDGYNPSRVGGSRGEPPVGFSRKLLASVIYEDTKGIPEDLKMTVALPKMSHVPEDEVDPSMDPLKTQFKSLSKCHNFSIQERIMEDEEDLEHHPFLQAAEKTMLATHSIPMGNKKRLAISSESRFPVAPSIKNFEVCRAPTNASSAPELGLARIGKERFFALVRYPFSPFEAFGVCISKFDATSSYRSKLGRRMSL